MYNHVFNYKVRGYCADIDFEEDLISGQVVISEDLKDALPYLYEKHFGIPYNELGWWLEPGAQEFVKDLEDKWFHNKLDLSEVYCDEEFLNKLVSENAGRFDMNLNDVVYEFEDMLRDELYGLCKSEIEDLYEYDDEVSYVIYDAFDNEIYQGWMSLPDLEDFEDYE